MTRNIIIALSIFALFGCWEKKGDEGSAFLDDDYDFIFGILVPDEDRIGPTEIYVGRILDRDVDHGGPDHITPIGEFGIQDSFQLAEIWYYQTEYRAPIINIDNATVVVTSNNQSVTFLSVGKGTYRDVNNALHVYANETYTLQAVIEGKTYTAKTIVPDHVNITNLSEGDTVGTYPKKGSSPDVLCFNFIPVRNTASEHALLFRSKWSYPGRKPLHRLAFASDIDTTFGVVAQADETYPLPEFYQHYKYEIFALDTAMSYAYVSEGVSGKWNIFQFMNDNFYNGIAKRSNVRGEGKNKAAGTFGSYNAFRMEFTVKLLMDSCQCVFNFPCNLGKAQ